MRRKSIATQWFFNSFSVVAVLLLVIDIACFFIARGYYYNAARQFIETEANIVAGVLERFYDDTSSDYAEEIRISVEEFEKKNQAELMAINPQGRVYLSSSGFTPSESSNMPDYEIAASSAEKKGFYTGILPNDEKYMAFTVIHRPSGNAIRIITSLDKIDDCVSGITLAIGGASLAVMLLLLILGLYFVRSIVYPVMQVSSTAKKLATGDFSVRIDVGRDDEIGELCTVFNYMADELESSENIKNEFISSVSHELRTPLTAIKGWSETLLEIDDEETRRKGMQIINSETERLSGMVEELLDFSRIQNGRFTLNKAPTDVIAELGEAALIYEEKAKKDNISIYYRETDEIAVVNGDGNRLRQVFINVIDNAVKYGHEGGFVKISYSVGDRNISISVRDNGCGISETELPRVKEKFYKANNTVRGSGIGLAVADEIVKLHGGELLISSKQGEGTEVKIILPIVT